MLTSSIISCFFNDTETRSCLNLDTTVRDNALNSIFVHFVKHSEVILRMPMLALQLNT